MVLTLGLFLREGNRKLHWYHRQEAGRLGLLGLEDHQIKVCGEGRGERAEPVRGGIYTRGGGPNQFQSATKLEGATRGALTTLRQQLELPRYLLMSTVPRYLRKVAEHVDRSATRIGTELKSPFTKSTQLSLRFFLLYFHRTATCREWQARF